MSELYRVIYTSRDLIAGGPDERRAEIDGIVAASRRNNGRDGVTGALLLGAGAFAQILEGPRAAVEAAFERIQCDARHGDIDVLQCEPVAGRIFPNWEMALVGRSERGRMLWRDLTRVAPLDPARLDADRLCAAVLAAAQAEERTPEAGAPEARPRLAAVPPGPSGPADPGDAVLRAALEEERERTTALRRALDEARVALARAAAEAEALGRHRDIWADRSRQLRSSLGEARGALAAAAAERDAAGGRLALREGELARCREERDVWADCARALAAALRIEAAVREGEGAPERERPALKAVAG